MPYRGHTAGMKKKVVIMVGSPDLVDPKTVEMLHVEVSI